MAKTVDEVLGYMEEYVKRSYEDMDGFISGFTPLQYRAAQEATDHWLKLLRQTRES